MQQYVSVIPVSYVRLAQNIYYFGTEQQLEEVSYICLCPVDDSAITGFLLKLE